MFFVCWQMALLKWSVEWVPTWWDDKRVSPELSLGRIMAMFWWNQEWWNQFVLTKRFHQAIARENEWQAVMDKSVWALECECECLEMEEGHHYLCCYCFTFDLPHLPNSQRYLL